MKNISRWGDLERYGIDCLTGEACGLGYRLLCDVTAKGKRTLERVFDCQLTLSRPWNSGGCSDPHIGCIMMAPEMLTVVGAFALLEYGCTEVWLVKGKLMGVDASDDKDEVERWREANYGDIQQVFSYRGTASDRNTHTMSGRER